MKDNRQLKGIIEKHDNWRNSCINLVPSENIMSRDVAKALSSDMGHRYFFSKTFETETGISYEYRGTKHIQELYEVTTQIAKNLFKADYVNLSLLSGHIANLNILFSYCRPGDTIICTDTNMGGYPGLASDKLPSYLGINVEFLPQESIGGQVDIEALEKLILKTRPKIVMLSSSITIFPFPVEEVSALCKLYNIPFCYDASHPLGLIAGGAFQQPFDEGADLIIGSTHKSFPGPQGGIILGRGDQYQAIENATDFIVVDNIHLNRIAALAISMLEMKKFGQDYAKQIIANSKALAKALYSEGFDIAHRERGYTESHQFLMNSNSDYSTFTKNLEETNIILDNSGRVGLNEVTRVGMKENDMPIIASFFRKILEGENDSKLKSEIREFKSQFNKMQYCFQDNESVLDEI
jgi:glycine hydroxymethyltransferase